MAKLSKHAKERLLERFDLDPEDIEVVGNLFNQRNKYKVVSFSMVREIREIEYKGNKIQCVIRDGSIKTCHWDTFVADDELLDKDQLLKDNGQLVSTVKDYEKKFRRHQTIMKKLAKRNWFYCISYIWKLKHGWEDREDTD